MKVFSVSSPNIIQPIVFGNVGFKRKPIVLSNKISRWRGIVDLINLSGRGRLRLEWMVFFGTLFGVCNF